MRKRGNSVETGTATNSNKERGMCASRIKTGIRCVFPKRVLIQATVVTMALLLLMGRQATASQSPPNCLANRLGLDVAKSATIITNGGSVQLTVRVFNPTPGSSDACDIDMATVTLACAAPDGTSTGATTTLDTGASFPVFNLVTML